MTNSGWLAPDSAWWRRLAYAGARFGPEPWLRLSPPLFGLAFAALCPRRRRAVRSNLRLALGPRSMLLEQLDVARTFACYAGCLAEALAIERPEVQRAARSLRNEDGLNRVLNAKTGLIIATAHVGPWDVAAPLLGLDTNRAVLIAMQAEPDPVARELHDRLRARAGVRVVHVGSHPLDALPLLHHLRGGGIVALQVDRVAPGSRSIEVELFGRPFEMPQGPFTLAALTGAPILPLFARRIGFLDYELSGGALVVLPPRPDPETLRRATEGVARELERAVRACPTQWFRFESSGASRPSLAKGVDAAPPGHGLAAR